MASDEKINTYKATATIVGVIYLAGFIVGIGGNVLIQSVLAPQNYLSTVSGNSMKIAFGAILWLFAVAGDIAHGILMFPILKLFSERIAVGYAAARIVDAVFIAIMVLFILLQIPIAEEYVKAGVSDSSHLQELSSVFTQASQYAYQIGMSALGLSGLMLCYILYKKSLVPRFAAVWGFAGYAVIFCGMLSEMMGSGFGLASSIPGGLWEVFIGVWLIVKGFNSHAFVSGTPNGK